MHRLEELHASINQYNSVNISAGFQHSSLQVLHLNDNQITEWEELAKLSSTFPSLRTLIACSTPIQTIPDMDAEIFPSLQTLNLNGSALSDWASIENLNTPSNLTELSLLNVPVGSDLEAKQRRHAFIARLPCIQKLNKSKVGDTEREKAERWLIREAKGQPNPPKVYQQLLEKHGDLEQLADVNLGPPKYVLVKFHFEGMEREDEEREVDVDQTVGCLKKWMSRNMVGIPPTNLRLWYGLVRLKDDKKFLYTLRLHDGDVIQVQIK